MRASIKETWLIGLMLIVFAIVALLSQIWQLGPDNATRLAYLETVQVERNEAVIQRRAGDTWRYRILAPYLVEATRETVQKIIDFKPSVVAYLAVRGLQNILLFFLTYAYWRKLGLSRYLVIVGMMLFVWGIAFSNYGSDLSYNTYFDLIFYVLACLLALNGKVVWVLPLMVFAAINRETSIFLPSVVLASAWVGVDRRKRNSQIRTAIAAIAIFAVVTLGIRAVIGPTHYSPGNTPLELLQSNLTRPRGYFLLFMTFGVFPVLAIVNWKYWPQFHKALFWLLALPWLISHFALAAVVETRLLLVPNVLLFIPAFLLSFEAYLCNRTHVAQSQLSATDDHS